MIRSVWLATLALFIATASHADQQAFVDRDDAVRALDLIDGGPPVRHYCEPCGDRTWREIEVLAVEAAATGFEHYWEVSINGDAVDLAYTYVVFEGRWQNLAAVLGLEVSDVPLVLDDTPAAWEPTPRPAAPPQGLSSLEDEMDSLLSELSSRLGPERRPTLVSAQEAWLRYREAQAELEAEHLSGTGSYAGALDSARSRLTRERIRELGRLLEGA